MYERLYFHEVIVHLNFRYCACFEQEVLKLQSVDSLWNARSSHRRCSVRKGVLTIFAKFTGKHLCQNLFFLKKRDSSTGAFLWIFMKFLRTPFLHNTSTRLLPTRAWHNKNVKLLLILLVIITSYSCKGAVNHW